MVVVVEVILIHDSFCTAESLAEHFSDQCQHFVCGEDLAVVENDGVVGGNVLHSSPQKYHHLYL